MAVFPTIGKSRSGSSNPWKNPSGYLLFNLKTLPIIGNNPCRMKKFHPALGKYPPLHSRRLPRLGSPAPQHFQALEVKSPDFPTIGKAPAGASKHWTGAMFASVG